jgi:hypothetical protein
MLCALALSGLLQPACRHTETDPTDGPSQTPGLTARMYVLRSVAGDELPAVLLDNEFVTIVSLADTIWLESDGTGLELSTERSTDKGSGAAPITRQDERPFSYAVVRGRIEVGFECLDVIIRSCSPPPHLQGTLTEDRMVLDHAFHYRAPLEYQRVRR